MWLLRNQKAPLQHTMDKYLIRAPQQTYKSTFELLDEPVELPKQKKGILLGVLGHSTHSHWTKETILNLVNPLLGELEEMPTSILLPTEGDTSLYIQDWAERLKISCSPLVADFTKLGKKAKFLRDNRIIKDSTHLLVFLGARSDKNEKIALKELKKGKRVFTVSPETKELEEWVEG